MSGRSLSDAVAIAPSLSLSLCTSGSGSGSDLCPCPRSPRKKERDKSHGVISLPVKAQHSHYAGRKRFSCLGCISRRHPHSHVTSWKFVCSYEYAQGLRPPAVLA
eukprot:6208730-Pleurochrysis_carterae.AAC.2